MIGQNGGGQAGASFKSEREAVQFANSHRISGSSERTSSNKWLKLAYEHNFKNLNEVRDFLRKHGLKADGKIGKNTLAAIEAEKTSRKKSKKQQPVLNDLQALTQQQDSYTAMNSQRPEYNEDEHWGVTNALHNVINDNNSLKLTISYLDQKIDAVANDLGIGSNRVGLHQNGKYSDDNPFKQGANDVANVAMSILLGYGVAQGVAAGIITPLLEGGLSALPQVLAGAAAAVGGGYVGATLTDMLSKALTGKSWNENMKDAGANSFNAHMSNPGGWTGSYAATYGLNYGLNRGVLRPAIEEPGLQYSQVPSDLPISFMQSPLGQSMYQYHYTSRPSGSRGSSAGQGKFLRVVAGGSGNQSGYNYRLARDIQQGGGLSFNLGVSYPMYYPSTPVYGIPFDTWSYATIPLKTPPITSPAPEPEYGYQVRVNPAYEFNQWFGELVKRGNTGTLQYYPGDEYYKPGWRRIERAKNFQGVDNIGKVYDAQGYNIPDSTRRVSGSVKALPNVVYRVNGRRPQGTGELISTANAVDAGVTTVLE